MEIVSNLIEAHLFREKNNELEFLLLKRSDRVIFPGLWQMVNGKIEKYEKAYQTALREIKEETGISPDKLWVVPKVNKFYSHQTDQIILLPVFAALTNPNSQIILSNEHTEHKWVSTSNAKKMLAWVEQRKVVDIIVKYYLNERNFLDLIEIPLNNKI